MDFRQIREIPFFSNSKNAIFVIFIPLLSNSRNAIFVKFIKYIEDNVYFPNYIQTNKYIVAMAMIPRSIMNRGYQGVFIVKML